MTGSGAAACLPTMSFDSFQGDPPRGKDDDVRQRFLSIEPRIAPSCPRGGASEADARHARIGPRAGARVNLNRTLVRAISKDLKRLFD